MDEFGALADWEELLAEMHRRDIKLVMDLVVNTIEDYRDIETLNLYQELVQEKGMDPQAVLAIIHAKSRDNARTPKQWDESEHAGFTRSSPWLKVNPNYKEINVKQALADPNSIFYYYQKLIRLRREHPIIVYGTYDLILDAHEEIYAFTRTLEDERLLVILNFTQGTPVFALPPELHVSTQELLIGNYPVQRAEDLRQLTLRPYEARVYHLKA